MKNGMKRLAAILILSGLSLAGVVSFAAEFEVLDRFSVDGYSVFRGSADIPGGLFSVGTSTFVVKNGNVGIATANPAQKLEVSGGNINIPYAASRTNGYMLGLGNDIGYIWRNYAYSDDGLFISQNWYRNDAGDTNVIPNPGHATTAIQLFRDGAIRFLTGGTNIAPSLRMLIDNTGNVGIGTAGPGGALDIQSGTNSKLGGLWLGKPGVSSGYLSVRDNLYIHAGTGQDTAAGMVDIANHLDVSKIRLNTNGDSYFIGGNVGIGTINPAGYALNIGGSAYVNGDLVAGGGKVYKSYTSFTPSGTGLKWVRLPYSSQNQGEPPVHLIMTRSINDNDNTPYGGASLELRCFGQEWHNGQQYCMAQYGYHGSGGAEITHATIRNNAGGGYYVYLRLNGGVSYKIWAASDSGNVGAPEDNATGAPPVSDSYALTTGLNIIGDTTPNLYVAGNVGIGTTGPEEKLDVNGTAQAAKFELNAAAASNYNVQLVTCTGDGGSNTVQTYWNIAYGVNAAGGCLGAYSRSGVYAAPGTTISGSNTYTIYGFIGVAP